jgi:hypothetical protein
MRLPTRSLVPFTLGVVVLALLSACGGGSGSAAPPVTPNPPPVTPTKLTGTAAVGAPMTSGTLRVLDATGAVVAHDVPIHADGTYDAGTLAGTSPWRIEACGYTGANYGCIYSVAQAAGTANVTPLTTAMITLATGQAPATVMSGGASAPSGAALQAAQAQLRAGLASTLADAGVPATFDFTTGSLAAGTRNGYDRVLDAVNVTTGTDDGAFVQVTPRLGDGNLYLTTGTTTGTITTAAGASDLPLGGLETLFARMTAAAASPAACSDAAIGLATVIASDARISMGGSGLVSGGANVAAGMCRFFGTGDGGQNPIWGAHLVSPTLGRCDLTGTDPVCAVSFALEDTDGGVENVGDGMGVVYRGGRWQFYGDLLPVSIHANAAVQRGVRVDDPTTPVQYQRALQFDIAVTPGVECVRVSQPDTGGAQSTIAFYKVNSANAQRMSLWQASGPNGNSPSTDPAAGTTNGDDSSWVSLPDGAAGDEVVRTFYRAGRSVTMSLFSNSACSTPATVEGKSAYTIDVNGMPPVSTQLGNLAWGALTADTVAALEALALDGGHTGSFTGAWTFVDGVTGFDQMSFCSQGSCGQGSDSRLGDTSFHPNVHSVLMPLKAPVTHLLAGDFKMLVLGGRDASGMNVESSFFSCTGTPAGQMCGQGTPPSGGGAPTSGPALVQRRAH